jgi:hypothetical protein
MPRLLDIAKYQIGPVLPRATKLASVYALACRLRARLITSSMSTFLPAPLSSDRIPLRDIVTKAAKLLDMGEQLAADFFLNACRERFDRGDGSLQRLDHGCNLPNTAEAELLQPTAVSFSVLYPWTYMD